MAPGANVVPAVDPIFAISVPVPPEVPVYSPMSYVALVLSAVVPIS